MLDGSLRKNEKTRRSVNALSDLRVKQIQLEERGPTANVRQDRFNSRLVKVIILTIH